jgi:hypothetical protein
MDHFKQASRGRPRCLPGGHQQPFSMTPERMRNTEWGVRSVECGAQSNEVRVLFHIPYFAFISFRIPLSKESVPGVGKYRKQ